MFWFKTKDDAYINLALVETAATSTALQDCLILTFAGGDRQGIQGADDIARLRSLLDRMAMASENSTHALKADPISDPEVRKWLQSRIEYHNREPWQKDEEP
jgi:hypothetical protein